MIKSKIIHMMPVIVLANLAAPLGGQVVESPTFNAQELLFTSIDFADSLTGWLAGERVLRTRDGGRTWHMSGDSSFFSWGIDFLDPLTGWGAASNDSSGIVVHSIDGGQTWQTSYEDSVTDRLKTVTFVDELHGWAAGGEGVIVHTSDGGANWQRQESGVDRDLDWITFVDTLHGWAVGRESHLLRTEDGGRTWLVNDSVDGSRKVVFFDQLIGYLFTAFIPQLFKTTDGGKTWEVVVQNRGEHTGYDLFMLDPMRAWWIIDSSHLISTQDGFATRTGFGHIPWCKVYFLNDGLTGWGIGNLCGEGFGHTLDGGKTWTDRLPLLRRVPSLTYRKDLSCTRTIPTPSTRKPESVLRFLVVGEGLPLRFMTF